jgi:uncharacterized phage infection (PIP) family protein YhgE
MDDELSKDDMLELQRRRMAEQVQEDVEKTLRKRYSWLAIIVSFLIGGGVIMGITTLSKDAQKKIFETEILLERSKKTVLDADNISKDAKEKFEKFDKELAGAFAGKEAVVTNLKQITSQIEKLDTKVNKLVSQLNISLEKQNLPKISPSIDDKTQVKKLQEQISLSKLTVYLQYYDEQNKNQMEQIRNLLIQKGYAVPKVELIKHHRIPYRDIRYFHDDEEGEAQQLKADVEEFLTQNKYPNIKFDLQNRSKAYPNVQKGIIELWIYF